MLLVCGLTCTFVGLGLVLFVNEWTKRLVKEEQQAQLELAEARKALEDSIAYHKNEWR